MTLRRFWFGLAICVAIASGCSRSDPQPGQPRLLKQVDHRFADDLTSTPIVPVALTVDRASEKPMSEAPPEVLAEQPPFGMTALRSTVRAENSHILSQAVKSLRTKLSVIANNLANCETLGFKRSRVTLEDCAYQNIRLSGAQDAFNNYAPTGNTLGGGCRVQGIQTDFSQGPIADTGRQLDVAIEGDGFFQTIDPTTNNFFYTRAGSFALNCNGLLCVGSASTGRLVQPQLSLPITTMGIVISAEGNVSIRQFGQTQFSQVGQLQLAKFLNPEGLLKMGENLYQETHDRGVHQSGKNTPAAGTVAQGLGRPFDESANRVQHAGRQICQNHLR